MKTGSALQPGTAVTWISRRRDGSIVSSIRTFTASSVQAVELRDGTSIDCVCLRCNRFVPVNQLQPGHDCDSGERLGVSPPSITTNVTRRVNTQPLARSVPKQSTPERPLTHTDSHEVPCELLVIDFMNLLVRAWHAGKPTESHAVRSMFQTVASAVRTLRPPSLVFAMDGGYAHRTKILPSYKAHRTPHDPDLARQRQLATDAIQAAGLCAVRIEDFEADDVIASIVARHNAVVVCSSDKDLLSLTGRARIYHPWGAGKFATAEDVLGVSPAQVSDYLALCGDTSDGVPGVKGIGPKTATDLLTTHGTLESILCAAKTLRIPGAAGKHIAAGSKDALLSEQLVALIDNLPLPELPRWKPVDGWQQKLTAMRLGSVAAILDGLTSILIPSLLPRAGGEGGRRPDEGSAIAVAAVIPRAPKSLFNDSADPVAETGVADRAAAVAPSSDSRSTDLKSEISNLKSESAGVVANYERAGFTITKESTPVPGTNLKPKHFATWTDGSRWLLDQNSRRHICISDSPITGGWTIDRRGPVDPKTNAVRKVPQ